MKERSNISLKPLDDIFSTEESRADAQREKVTMVPLEELHPFRNHPFKVVDDEKMMDTAQSIREHGVLVPAIVRPLESGGYELVSGHRRKRGCELAGFAEMPVIIRDMDDDMWSTRARTGNRKRISRTRLHRVRKTRIWFSRIRMRRIRKTLHN